MVVIWLDFQGKYMSQIDSPNGVEVTLSRHVTSALFERSRRWVHFRGHDLKNLEYKS